MSNENTENNNETAGNGVPHGTANGSSGDPLKTESASHKKKHKRRGARAQVTSSVTPAAPPPVDTAAEVVNETPEIPTTTVPMVESVEAQTGTAEASTPPQASEPAAAPRRQEDADGLRLRVKIWTDRATGTRYLMPTAFMRDIKNGRPVSDRMYAYAMRDDDTKLVTLTAREWNSLPFFYFQEDGPAPRATARPVDVIR